MKRIGWCCLVVVALGLGACKKADPSTPKYWEKLLDSRKKATDALTRIGDELKTPEQKKWGSALVLKHWDRDPEKAAIALGKLGYSDPSAVDKLMEGLKSSVPGLMSRSAKALRRLKGRKAVPLLIQTLDKWLPKNPRDITEVRKQVTKALGAMAGPEAVPVLSKMVADRKHGLIVNLLALEALGKIADARGIPALIHGLYLACPMDKCSAEARIALNRIGKKAVPALLRVVRRKDPAVEALAKSRKLKPEQVTAVPFIVLGDLGDGGVAKTIADEFLDKDSSFTRVAAIGAIGHTARADLTDDLIRAYRNSLLEERANILHALHRIGDRRALSFLRKVVSQREDPNLVWTAGLALSYLGDDEDLPVVKKVLARAQKNARKYKGERGAVAKQTVTFFRQFQKRLAAAKGCESAACWRGKLKAPDKQVRIKAARMLAFAKKDRAANESALIAALSDSDKEVRLEVAFSLSRIGTAKAVKPLEDRCRLDKDKSGMREPLFMYELLAARLKSRGA